MIGDLDCLGTYIEHFRSFVRLYCSLRILAYTRMQFSFGGQLLMRSNHHSTSCRNLEFHAKREKTTLRDDKLSTDPRGRANVFASRATAG